MKAKQIAESGILVAATLVILYAASIFPINKVSTLTIASCIIPISIIRNNIKNTMLVYIASSLLSIFILPINISIYYIFFFGIYGIIKFLIEKHNKLFFEIIMKLISFNILICLIYLITINFLGELTLPFSIYLLFGVGQFIFLIYDYVLTIVISFYLNKIHTHIS